MLSPELLRKCGKVLHWSPCKGVWLGFEGVFPHLHKPFRARGEFLSGATVVVVQAVCAACVRVVHVAERRVRRHFVFITAGVPRTKTGAVAMLTGAGAFTNAGQECGAFRTRALMECASRSRVCTCPARMTTGVVRPFVSSSCVGASIEAAPRVSETSEQ